MFKPMRIFMLSLLLFGCFTPNGYSQWDWLNQFLMNSSNSTYNYATAIGEDGSVYTTGTILNATPQGCPGGIPIARYDALGTNICEDIYAPGTNGICDEIGNAILLDENNDRIIIAGGVDGTPFLGFFDQACALNFLFEANISGTGSITGADLVNNQIYALGEYNGTLTIDGNSISGNGVFLAVFDLNGTLTDLFRISGPSSLSSYDITADNAGDIYISLSTNNDLLFELNTNQSYNHTSDFEVVVAKISSGFNLDWTNNIATSQFNFLNTRTIPLDLSDDGSELSVGGQYFTTVASSFLANIDPISGMTLCNIDINNTVISDLVNNCGQIYLTGNLITGSPICASKFFFARYTNCTQDFLETSTSNCDAGFGLSANETGSIAIGGSYNESSFGVDSLSVSKTGPGWRALVAQYADGASCCENAALRFDGNGDFVMVPNSPIAGTVDFTVEAWFLSEDSDGMLGCAANFERIFGAGGDRFEVGVCNGDFSVVVNSPTATGTGQPIVNGQWYHMAAVRSGDEINVYLDCNLVFSTNSPLNLNNTFRVGRWPGGGNDNENWEGIIDEFRVWDNARTVDQISYTKNCQLQGNEPGLVLYYPFNDGIPNGNNTSLTVVQDLSPSNNDGVLTNFVQVGPQSNFVCSFPLEVCDTFCNEVALRFDGDLDFIQVPNSPIQGSVDFTIETWFLSEDSDGQTGCSGNFDRIFGAGGNRFEIGTCDGELSVVANSGTAVGTGQFITNGQWYHLATTRTGNQIDVYLDCNLVYTDNTTLNLNNNFRIGRWSGGTDGGETWEGIIEDFRVWDHPRTLAQIATNKNCELMGNEPGLILYYPLNDGAPEGNNMGTTTVTDLSPSGNDGNLMNFFLDGPQSNFVCSLPLSCDSSCAASFEFEATGECGTYTFFNSSIGEGLTYCWDFDNDGICDSDLENPVFSFPTSGTYTVCLLIFSETGCAAQECVDIAVSFSSNPPIIDCPPTISIPCNTTTEIIASVSNSLCATFLEVVYNREDGLPLDAPYPKEPTLVSATATNDFGSSNCLVNVITFDNEAPTAICVDNLTIQLGGSCTVSISPDDLDNGSFDNCEIESYTLDIEGFDEESACETVPVTLTVEDCFGQTDQCITMVTVEDNIVPTIECPDHILLPEDSPSSTDITGMAMATDNCSVTNLTFTDEVTGGPKCPVDIERTFLAVDQCGNEATCLQYISIECADSTSYCNACAGFDDVSENLIANGDFSGGFSGFTSDYDQIPGNGPAISNGDYSIRNRVSLQNGNWRAIDHTQGIFLGPFLICDGSSDPSEACYRTNIPVEEGAAYNFCVYVNNLVVPTENFADPNIEIRINNNVVIPATTISETPDEWVLLTASWTAPAMVTNAEIEIFTVNASNLGHDIAIDDISFNRCGILNSTYTPGFGELEIFPNPTKSQFEIRFGQALDHAVNYQLLDLLGEVVQKGSIISGIHHHQISLDNLPAAVYILNLTDQDGQSWQTKIIKQ